MQQLDTILILMAILAVLYSVAARMRISYPVALVLAGLGIGLIPGLPIVRLSPDVVFLIFLPPLLFEAARNTSWHDFRNNSGAIGRLAIGLVFFTMASVAVCAHYFIPGFTWPLAFLLGAIVSPPDVVAATSATKGLNLPKRLITVLEGESLINDASALIAYRYALAAVIGGTFALSHAALQFFVMAGGGIALGIAIGAAFTVAQRKFLDDATVETIATLLVPYVAYLVAEHLGVSGVLSVVSTGLFISWRAHELFSYRTRMQMNSFWNTFVFLLNGLVFILIGLQLPEILKAIENYTLKEMIGYGLLISAVAIITRIVWVFPSVYIITLLARWRNKAGEPAQMNYKQLVVVGWSGMRGVVSLASALALPLMLDDGTAFPQRNVILFITFIVILVTLVLQGLTMPWLVRWLGVQEVAGLNAAEERKIRLKLSKSSLNYIDETFSDLHHRVVDELKRKFIHQITYLDPKDGPRRSGDTGELNRQEAYKRFLESEQTIIDHQRERLITMHKDGSASAATLAKIEKELDIWALGVAEKLKSLK